MISHLILGHFSLKIFIKDFLRIFTITIGEGLVDKRTSVPIQEGRPCLNAQLKTVFSLNTVFHEISLTSLTAISRYNVDSTFT